MIRPYKYKDGRVGYRVIVAVTSPTTGRRSNKSIGVYDTKSAARIAERDALRDRDHGELPMDSSITVLDVANQWLKSKRGDVTENTWGAYQSAVERFIGPEIGHLRVSKITPPLVQGLHSRWLDQGIGRRTIQQVHARLSQILDFAQIMGMSKSNPCRLVRPPKTISKAITVWTQEEATKFLSASMARPIRNRGGDTGDKRPDSLFPLWHFLLLEGMRRGEGLGLRWRDIDWAKGVAHIRQTVIHDGLRGGTPKIQDRTKTNAGTRSVRLTNQTLDALAKRREQQLIEREAAGDQWQNTDLIVCTSLGGPITPSNVRRSFRGIIDEAGDLPVIRVHDLRHTSASLLLMAGVPVKVVSERLGHASIHITLGTYGHLIGDMQGDAAEAMDSLICGRSSG